MSTTLFFLLPIGLLAVVWSGCFVGCTLPTSGIPTPYSNVILAEKSLLAYWPLNDAMGDTTSLQGSLQGSTSIGTATDLSGNGHTGTYILPPPYPQKPPGGAVEIVGIAQINLQQSSIVPGDVGNSYTKDQLPQQAASADFEGGYVSIPWSAPTALDSFTLEAWIMPNANLTGFEGVLFSAFTAANTGFRVVINQSQLAVVFGDGTTNPPLPPSLGTTINFLTLTYIAVTCQAGSLTLFAQGVDETPTQPQALGSFTYVAADPTQPATYFIGAGANELPLRTPTANPNGAPEFPFLGQIQSVALYGSALSNTDLLNHFSAGSPG